MYRGRTRLARAALSPLAYICAFSAHGRNGGMHEHFFCPLLYMCGDSKFRATSLDLLKKPNIFPPRGYVATRRHFTLRFRSHEIRSTIVTLRNMIMVRLRSSMYRSNAIFHQPPDTSEADNSGMHDGRVIVKSGRRCTQRAKA